MMRALGAWLALLLLGLWAVPVAAKNWATVWATAPFALESKDAIEPEQLTGSTLRQTLLLTGGGERIRIRFSNRAGRGPLRIGAAAVSIAAGAGSSEILGQSLPVAFGGRSDVAIPAGAEYVSDPIALPVGAMQHLALTLRIVEAPSTQTGHPGARTNSHVAPGDQLGARTLAGSTQVTRWFFLSAVEAEAATPSTIAILGDSIADGYGVTPDSDTRWPDHLARRLQSEPASAHLAVANLGIGGNRLLQDGLGPNAMSRLGADVLALQGVSHLIVHIGVNDLGVLTRNTAVSPEAHEALVLRMTAAFAQIAAQARSRGIKVIGATIMPFGGSDYYRPAEATEKSREAINRWIRQPGNFDAVIDFDAAMRNPEKPSLLRADVDSGDGLHPSAAGYLAMANAVPLKLFADNRRRIVLTFDDLPQHGPMILSETPTGIAKSLVSTLKAHNVKWAYGYVNGEKIERDPNLQEPLEIWRKGGFTLGNHGWSHENINRLDDAGFEDQLVRNEARLKGAPRSFRYPFLSEGNAPQLRDSARAILARRGYRIAPVSMDFSDWAFNTAYARCVSQTDKSGVRKLEAAFLADAEAAARYADANGRELAGRPVPQVLLLHAGAFTAHMLPQLLSLYERHGYSPASLDEALADPIYAAAADPSRAFDTTTLSRRPGALPKPSGTDLDAICPA